MRLVAKAGWLIHAAWPTSWQRPSTGSHMCFHRCTCHSQFRRCHTCIPRHRCRSWGWRCTAARVGAGSNGEVWLLWLLCTALLAPPALAPRCSETLTHRNAAGALQLEARIAARAGAGVWRVGGAIVHQYRALHTEGRSGMLSQLGPRQLHIWARMVCGNATSTFSPSLSHNKPCTLLAAVHVLRSALRSCSAAQVSQPWQLSVFMAAQLATSGHRAHVFLSPLRE